MFKSRAGAVLWVLVMALAAPGAPGATGGGTPQGYSVTAATDAGKKLVVHKADARSVSAGLAGTLQDFSRYFDGQPIARGAFADARDPRRGAALFSGTLKGQPVIGLVYCVIGEQGADITVTYCRADAPPSEWDRLSSTPNTPTGAALAGVSTRQYAFPDGTGSIQLPDGWTTTSQTTIHGVRIRGPAEQTVSLGVRLTVNTPDSPMVQSNLQMAARARKMGLPPPKTPEMLVAPYSDPVTALKNLCPQLSQMSQRQGGPGIILGKMLETPAPAQVAIPGGQASTVYYTLTKTARGTSVPFRVRGRYESAMLGAGMWCLYLSEITGPEATFDKDSPVMLGIATSLRTDPQAVQRAAAREANAQNANFRAAQRAHAAQVGAFDDYFKSIQQNSLTRDRSAVDFIEVIRGARTVEDTQTGYRTGANLGNVDQIVEQLNERDPGRYKQIPLRDELAPLPNR